jgi:hypothetical protein
MSQDHLVIIGVRHHSPACARRVRRVIESIAPAFVLIEGPSDFNPFICDLKLEHSLPIAIFSFCSSAELTMASYSPFCSYSPEWQALVSARSAGAEPLFCDLPAWHPEFEERANRYADPHELHKRCRAAMAALARELGAEGQDAMWDALAEQAEDASLPAILDSYFSLMRPEGALDPAEAAREACMADYAAWALREAPGRPVVLVCGGWHVSGIRDALSKADGTKLPAFAPPEGARSGSYLVPYSYERLDRFTGYAAGMPSPGYYDAVHVVGLNAAADWAMQRIAKTLRGVGQPISTADQIGWRGHAEALARLRGHRAILRADILDAGLAVLIKDALEIPVAWAAEGSAAQRNDPFVGAMLHALSGNLEGKLAPGTRQPPLVADVEARMQAEDIVPAPALKRIQIDWHDTAAQNRAHILHQLRILGLPGIVRQRGPQHAGARDLTETFEISAHRNWAGSLIEASRWGGTLPMAASAFLNARAAGSDGDLEILTATLSDALFAGLLGLGKGLIARLSASVSSSRDIASTGRAARQISQLYRFGGLFGPAAHASLGLLAEAAFSRILWLIQGITSEEEGRQSAEAVLACRELARDSEALSLDRQLAAEIFARCLADPETPPGLAGAALGYLVSCGDAAASSAEVSARIRRFGLPASLGDFLAGLFALAREELKDAAEVLGAINEAVAAWPAGEFLKALPAMRLAFSWFPPAEREALARAILERHGMRPIGAEAEALAWMRQKTGIEGQAAALELEERTAARLARHGLA